MYCSQLCTHMRNMVTWSKCWGSETSVVCAVVTATPQTIKCISVLFDNLCIFISIWKSHWNSLLLLNIYLVSLKFFWNIPNYYVRNWTTEFNGIVLAVYCIIFILKSPYISHFLNQSYNHSASVISWTDLSALNTDKLFLGLIFEN